MALNQLKIQTSRSFIRMMLLIQTVSNWLPLTVESIIKHQGCAEIFTRARAQSVLYSNDIRIILRSISLRLLENRIFFA